MSQTPDEARGNPVKDPKKLEERLPPLEEQQQELSDLSGDNGGQMNQAGQPYQQGKRVRRTGGPQE